MTVLDCNVVSCVYNEDKSCRRSSIEVEGHEAMVPSETCCGSFSNRKDDCCKESASCNSSKKTEVCCEAVECKFNDNKECQAKHIGIAGGHADQMRETECASFSCC